MHSLPWTVALTAALTLLGATVSLWAWQWGRRRKSVVLPTEWALTSRPVFSADERKLHRLLRQTLPSHLVLSKLPLVRFCQPTEPREVRYWFDLLRANHVTFAICSTNGRVLAAIDLETDRGASGRVIKIKQSVLDACGVPYLRCASDQLPSAAQLQLLVLKSGPDLRAAPPATPTTTVPRETHRGRLQASDAALPHSLAHAALWHESTSHWDSFFAPDSCVESFSPGNLCVADGFVAEPAARPPVTPVPSVFVPEFSAHPTYYDDIAIGAPRFSASTRL